MQPAFRRPAPSAWSVLLPAPSTVTGEQAAAGSQQFGPSGVGAKYADILAGPVAPSQPSGSLKHTAMDLDQYEPGVSRETINRPMSSVMSGTLSSMTDGTTANARLANACLRAGERSNKTTTFIS